MGARATMWCSVCAEGCIIVCVALGKAESHGLAPSLVPEDAPYVRTESGWGRVCGDAQTTLSCSVWVLPR